MVGKGGIHAGSFRWEGPFGTLAVTGIGWGSRPRGAVIAERTAAGQIRFAERMDGRDHVIAIWNGNAGTAYFRSAKPFSDAQRAAIDRVALFQEGEEPTGCNLRTTFSWE